MRANAGCARRAVLMCTAALTGAAAVLPAVASTPPEIIARINQIKGAK